MRRAHAPTSRPAAHVAATVGSTDSVLTTRASSLTVPRVAHRPFLGKVERSLDGCVVDVRFRLERVGRHRRESELLLVDEIVVVAELGELPDELLGRGIEGAQGVRVALVENDGRVGAASMSDMPLIAAISEPSTSSFTTSTRVISTSSRMSLTVRTGTSTTSSAQGDRAICPRAPPGGTGPCRCGPRPRPARP